MRGGHKSGRPQKGFNALVQRLAMLELIQQNQLIQQDRAQYKQLGAAQAFDGYLTTPFEHILEQAVERLNRLRTQLVKDAAHLNPTIAVRMLATPRGDQPATSGFTSLSQIRRVVVSITQNVAHFSRQLPQQGWSNAGIVGVGNRQLSRQRYPDRRHGTRQMQFPAVPPAMIARLRPARLGVDAAVRHDTLLPMFVVPHRRWRAAAYYP